MFSSRVIARPSKLAYSYSQVVGRSNNILLQEDVELNKRGDAPRGQINYMCTNGYQRELSNTYMSVPIQSAATFKGMRFFASNSGIRVFDDLTLRLPSNPLKKKEPKPDGPKLVLYRGKGMLIFRILVRAKVFQLVGVFSACILISAMISTQSPSTSEVAAIAALIVGCVVTSYCIWYYSGRYVGELALLLPERKVVRFSVLDFWGNREDNDYPVEQMVPPWRNVSIAEVKASVRQPVTPVTVTGDRQYYLSLSHGKLLDPVTLQNLLYGRPLDEQFSEEKFSKKFKDVLMAQETQKENEAVAKQVIEAIMKDKIGAAESDGRGIKTEATISPSNCHSSLQEKAK